MKKVLLVYGYHKSGHYSAVRALEEELEGRGVTSEIYNLWEGKAKTIDELFTIFRAFAANGVKKVPDFLITPELLDIFVEELPFDKNLSAYDTIISTHQYSSSFIAAQKIKQGCDIPLIHVNVNFTPFPFRTHPKINFYAGAVPREDADNTLYQKIVATGIPVRKAFQNAKTSKEKLILILGGADGFGEIEKIAKFATNINPSYEKNIICGRNIMVYEQLKKRFPSKQIFGYVEDLSEQFRKAEFVITKASGLTVAEALNCECIPIFPPPILFWEDDAARYVSAQGAGVCLPDFGQTSIKTINALINSEDIKEAFRERGRSLAKPHAAKDIVDLIYSPRKIIPPNDQAKMVEEMKNYRATFSSAQDLPKLAKYLTEQIEDWLRNYEPHNNN